MAVDLTRDPVAADLARRTADFVREVVVPDLVFAHRFIDWNTLDHDIQRVDACRTREGELLLVELEDLNPYLPLDLVPDQTRDAFVTSMTASLHRFLEASPRT